VTSTAAIANVVTMFTLSESAQAAPNLT
jgi:hypothetical protein